jgi:acetyl-CoA C-acetyltransferase
MTDAVIASGVRTAINNSDVLLRMCLHSSWDLVIKESLKRADIGPRDVDELIMGKVISEGLGQNPVRQSAIYAGLPSEIG